MQRLLRGRSGFTLIGVLAGVVLPNLVQFSDSGQIGANAAELQNVQTAMDLYMADNSAATVTALAIETNDFAASTPVLYPAYLRQNPTTCSYTWATTGIVTPGTCP